MAFEIYIIRLPEEYTQFNEMIKAEDKYDYNIEIMKNSEA